MIRPSPAPRSPSEKVEDALRLIAGTRMRMTFSLPAEELGEGRAALRAARAERRPEAARLTRAEAPSIRGLKPDYSGTGDRAAP